MAPLWKSMLSKSSPLYRDALFSFSLWEWKAQERELLLLRKHTDRERTSLLSQLDKLSKELQQKDKVIESLRARLHQHHHPHRSDTPCSSHALSDATDQSDRISYVSDEHGSTNEDLELCSDVDGTSEPGQEETRTSEHVSHHGVLSRHPSVPSSMSSSHQSCPSMHCSSSPHTPADVQRQTGSTQSKPLQGFPFGHQQPADSSGFLPLSYHSFQPSPFSRAPSSLDASLAMKAGASMMESSALWDMTCGVRPVRLGADLSSGSSGYQSGTSHTGSDLMKEHLREIRSLRQRLEDSIQTNDRLRQQLEERLATTAPEKGAPTNIYIQGLDSVSQLSSEVRFLKEENRSLQTQLKQATRDGSVEAEQLREAMLLERSRLKEAELEAERWAEQSRELQAEAEARIQEVVQMKQDRQRNQDTISRLQHEVSVHLQELNESRGLVQSLQFDLQVCRRKSKVPPNTASSSHQGGASDSAENNRHGRHMLSHTEDLEALQQQLLEASSLLMRMEAVLCSLNASKEIHLLQNSDLGFFRKLLSDTKTLKQILQEADSLLRMFWRTALPDSKEVTQDGTLREEVVSLRAKLSEREQALRDTTEKLRSSNVTRDSMELFIVSQLSRTRDVLKKAKSNLEVKTQEASVSSPALRVS